MYRPPAYAGLLLASKAVIKEIQRLLYKESVFRALRRKVPTACYMTKALDTPGAYLWLNVSQQFPFDIKLADLSEPVIALAAITEMLHRRKI